LAEYGNIATRSKYAIFAANASLWKNALVSTLSCKTITKKFTGPNKGRHPELDAASHGTSCRNAKSLEVTNRKSCVSHERLAQASKIEHVRRVQLISIQATDPPAEELKVCFGRSVAQAVG
jgi:hypothetical protein